MAYVAAEGEKGVEANRRNDQAGVELSTRLALRPKEAAAALGICERTLRTLQPELPCIRVSGTVLYPVKVLEEWLARRAKAEQGRTDAVVEEVLDDLAG